MLTRREDGAGKPACHYERSYTYHGVLPGGLAMLLLVPVLLVCAGFFALAVAGGVVGALLLPVVAPLIWGRQRPRAAASDPGCIELDQGEYHTIESDSARRN